MNPTITLAAGVFLALGLSIGWAQGQKPSPELEAVGAKLMQEINAGIQCNANAIAGRNEWEKLKTELEGLKKELADAKQISGAGKTNGSGSAQSEVR